MPVHPQNPSDASASSERFPALNTIHCGDALTVMRTWPDAFVQCVVTSPPYWGLRDYKVAGQLGLEKSPDEYIGRMVEIFREIKRVLRDDGAVWLNIGDSFCNAKGAAKNPGGGVGPGGCFHTPHKDAGVVPLRRPNITEARAWGLKSGDLCGIPWRLALALQADGWWLRMDCIWHKKNPMPESVAGWRWEKHRIKVAAAPREFKGHERPQGARDDNAGKSFASSAGWQTCPGCPKCSPNAGLVLRRGSWRCTKSHEYVFHLAKSAEYYGDGVAAAEKGLVRHGQGSISHGHTQRNKRSVWSLSSAPCSLAHFATFPPALVRPCILSSTPEKCCAQCGAPWARIVEQTGSHNARWPGASVIEQVYEDKVGTSSVLRTGQIADKTTLGWRPTCSCNCPDVRPIVLDCFMGAGTTAMEAHWLKRDWVGIELKPEYIEIANKRLAAAFPLERSAP